MAGAGLELIVGARAVPGFGSAIVVGLGGMLVEVIKDVSLRLAPVDRATALAMLRETKAGTLLAGFRGKGPYDAEAAADAIAALSRVAAATSDTVAAIEINPLIVLERGAVGVDVLIQPANPETP
jgi:acetate---CoA ligase (ADP-forming)